MKKMIICLPALALAVVLSGSALAENSPINSVTLNEMGLAGIQVMSDRDAMTVRGRGYVSSGSKPWNVTYGDSSASISINTRKPLFGRIRFESSSYDGFLAEGRYSSGGAHESGALFKASISHSKTVHGIGSVTKTTTLKIGIRAGGSASSYSF